MHFSLSLRFKQWKGKQQFCGTIYLELWLNAGPTNIYFMVLVCLTFALSKHNQWGPPEVDWPSVLCHIDEAWGFSSSSGATSLKDLVKIRLFCVDVFQGQSRFWRGRTHTNVHARVFSPIYHLCHSQGFYDKVRSKGKTKHTHSLHIPCDTSVFIRKWMNRLTCVVLCLDLEGCAVVNYDWRMKGYLLVTTRPVVLVWMWNVPKS